MQSYPVINVAVVEILLSGLIIHHPEVPGSTAIPHIYPVHKSPKHRVHGVVRDGNGRQGFSAAEAKLKFHRFKTRRLQLLPQLPHHHVQLLHVAPEQVGHALTVQLAETFLSILLTEAVGYLHRLLQRDLVEASHLPDAPGGVFQHRMDIGSKFCRIDSRFLPLLCPQAIFQEIGQATLCLPVDLGSGQVQGAAIEGLHGFPLNLAQTIVPFLNRVFKAGQNIQFFCDFFCVPPGEAGPGFIGIRLGIALKRFRPFLLARHLRQSPEEEGGLVAGTADRDRLLRPAKNAVDFGEFRLNALHGAAGQGNAQLSQDDPLLIRQHAGRTAVARQLAFLRAQHDQVLLAVAAHGADRTHLHGIQHRRDGAHIVLAQQQPEQSGKMLRFPDGIAKHREHLLQCG